MDLSQSPERRVGIARYARENNWILDWRLSAFLIQGRAREYLASSQFDGVISMMSHQVPALERMVSAVKVPVVDIWHDFPEVDCARVLLDQRAIGRTGAQHLLERGYRELYFYSHTVDVRVAKVRWEGFAEAVRERDLNPHELLWDPETVLPQGKTRMDWLAEILLHAPKPLAVMAVNDVVATEVLDAAATAGFSVPEDVAVVGVDNDPILSELGTVPLSSVDIARDHLGYEAAALLDKLMNGAVRPVQPLLIKPSGVVLRRSTEAFAVSDDNLRKAARFIQNHFREPIGVNDVVAQTYLGRRRLQDLFHIAFGRSMNEQITRHRIAFAQHLLATTSHKLDKIAKLSGFTSGNRLSKVFRRQVGLTPLEYRHQYRTAPSSAEATP